MVRNFIALLLAVMLVGCSSSWVTVSDNKDYSFYQNGKLVCESTNSCKIGRSFGKEMLLEVRKDDIVYGHLLVAREDSKHGERVSSVIETTGGVFNFFMDACSASNSQSDLLLCLFVGGSALVAAPIAIVVSLAIPDNIGRLPKNMTIPVGADSVAAFPWDQPAKD